MSHSQAGRYDAVKADLHAVHWEFGNSKVNFESETTERFMSEGRDKIVRDAIRERKEPESMQLGKLLRKSHIALSHRPDREVAKTETKMRFVPQKIEIAESYADTNGAELRKSNIDLAVGQSKSGKDWKSVQTSEMSATEGEKFACRKPQGFEQLGAELRKSNVVLHAGRHDFRSRSLPIHRSTTHLAYVPRSGGAQENLASSLGVELRTSSIDVAFGGLHKNSASHGTPSWQSQQHGIMASHQESKWAARRPAGFEFLKKELQKTNVTLGTDKTVYGSEGIKRPVRDDRNAVAAGFIPGL